LCRYDRRRAQQRGDHEGRDSKFGSHGESPALDERYGSENLRAGFRFRTACRFLASGRGGLSTPAWAGTPRLWIELTEATPKQFDTVSLRK
jgi:hypothetical protein